jgi:hypothetical protein
LNVDLVGFKTRNFRSHDDFVSLVVYGSVPCSYLFVVTLKRQERLLEKAAEQIVHLLADLGKRASAQTAALASSQWW